MLLALLLAGCPSPKTDDSGTMCTAEAVASVTVTVTDTAGTPLRPDEVTYTVDGGSPQAAECVDSPCTHWVAGWETTGDFVVTAVLNRDVGDGCCAYDAEASGTATVEMDASGCHVAGQQLTIQLDTTSQVCLDTGCG